MNRCSFPFICLLCLLFLPSSLLANGRVECNAVRSKILARAVSYCIVLPPSFDADKTKQFPILYSLHGLGDNEQFFVHSGAWNLVEDLLEKGELKELLIATPDGGASFYINSKDGKVRYEDFLLQEFFPFIEKRYRAAPGRANRAISGVSMGGYLGGNSQQPNRSRIFAGTFGNPPDPALWDLNNPLFLARTATLAGLKIYFDCGDQDDYGFDSGVIALNKLLTSRHIPHEFHLYPGRHDPAYFAAHLSASLIFASQAFPK